MRTIRSYLTVVCFVAVLAGCKKDSVVVPEAASTPPEFGSTDQVKTVAAFITGKWCPGGGVDSESAEKFGIDPNSEIDVTQHWQFNADGTFVYGKLGYDSKITGHWTEAGNGISLKYEMWDDETIYGRLDRLNKEQEGGSQNAIAAMMAYENTMAYLGKLTYIELSGDKKGLTFTQPGEEPIGGTDIINMVTSTDLVRMK